MATHPFHVIAERLLERLDLIKCAPKRVLLFSALDDQLLSLAQARFPEADFTTITEDNLSVADTEAFDLILLNCLPTWRIDVGALLVKWFSALKPEGLILFTTLGPDTAKGLIAEGTAFIDMHDIGDALLQAQFCDPVMDMANLEVRYRQQENLQNFMTVNQWPMLPEPTAESLGLEIIYGHAWKGSLSKAKDGEVRISIEQLRQSAKD